MSAVPARRCRTGSMPSSTTACSYFASRTPTRPATGRSGPRASSTPSTGSASSAAATKGPTSSPPSPTSTGRPPSGYGTPAAYYCDCTRDAIEARTGNKYGGYDGFCRDRGLGPGEGRALRFRTPDEGETVVNDLIRGVVTTANANIEDFVI